VTDQVLGVTKRDGSRAARSATVTRNPTDCASVTSGAHRAAAEHEQLRRRCDHLDERVTPPASTTPAVRSPHARAPHARPIVDGPRERERPDRARRASRPVRRSIAEAITVTSTPVVSAAEARARERDSRRCHRRRRRARAAEIDDALSVQPSPTPHGSSSSRVESYVTTTGPVARAMTAAQA